MSSRLFQPEVVRGGNFPMPFFERDEWESSFQQDQPQVARVDHWESRHASCCWYSKESGRNDLQLKWNKNTRDNSHLERNFLQAGNWLCTQGATGQRDQTVERFTSFVILESERGALAANNPFNPCLEDHYSSLTHNGPVSESMIAALNRFPPDGNITCAATLPAPADF